MCVCVGGGEVSEVRWGEGGRYLQEEHLHMQDTSI